MSHPVTGFLEGLMGGVQAGSEFRHEREDRRTAADDRRRRLGLEDRRMMNEDEDRQMRRAADLRAQVASGLQNRETEGAIHQRETAAGQDADRRQRVGTAAALIRQSLGDDPRYRGILLLPDEDLVREAGDLMSHPERSEPTPRPRTVIHDPGVAPYTIDENGRAQPVTGPDGRPFGPRPFAPRSASPISPQERDAQGHRRDVGVMQGQLRDAGGQLRGAQDRLDVAASAADSSSAQADISRYRTTADSLRTEISSAAAAAQGRPTGPAPADDVTERARARATQLQQQGKSRAEILRILRSEGFNVQ